MNPASNLRLISVYHVEPEPTWRMPAHRHDFHELIVICGGVTHVQLPDAQLQGQAGDVFFYPAGVEHEEWTSADDPLEQYALAFEWDLQGWEMNDNSPPLHVHDSRQRISLMAGWVHEEWVSQQPHADLTRQRLFEAIMAEWYRLSVQQQHPLVEAVRRHTIRHIEGEFSLDDLAAEVGMSKYHFVRTYKDLTGRTPMRDVRALRVEYAQRLLIETEESIEKVASRAGLGDKYRMTRLFRQYLDATPTEIRRTRDLKGEPQ